MPFLEKSVQKTRCPFWNKASKKIRCAFWNKASKKRPKKYDAFVKVVIHVLDMGLRSVGASHLVIVCGRLRLHGGVWGQNVPT